MKQEARIVQGVKSSELTGREAVRLQAQHNAIQREIARDRADDGKLGPVERPHRAQAGPAEQAHRRSPSIH